MPIIIISKRKYEAKISKLALEACDSIINDMGAELHDDLIQRLTILRLSLDRLERSISDVPEAENLLTTIKTEFQEVIKSVRKTSRMLLPVYMNDSSFLQRIEILCQNLQRPDQGTIHFHSCGIEKALSATVEANLNRIIQELIHNAFKHSSAWHIWVRLTWTNVDLKIEVEDDGTGFSKVSEFIDLLNKKRNTLRMRCSVINATIKFAAGEKGLIAKVRYPF